MWPETGKWAQVETIQGDTIIGQIFQINNALEIAILMEPVVPDDYDCRPVPLRPPIQHLLRIINLSIVKAVKSFEQEINRDLPVVKPIKIEQLLRREQRALTRRQVEFGRRAPFGTSPTTMAIFAALAKTYFCSNAYLPNFPCRLPCCWHKDEGSTEDTSPIIVVLEEVYVCPPYKPSSCRGTMKSNPVLVERVKKVLECERKRLGLDNDGS